MLNQEIPYSKEESKAYILYYCVQIALTLSKEELDHIKSKTNLKHIAKARKEICGSNDYQIIQKIQQLVRKYWRKEEERNQLFQDIRTLLITDGRCNQMVRNLFRGLYQLFTSDKY